MDKLYLGLNGAWQLYRRRGQEIDALLGAGLDLTSIDFDKSVDNTYRSLNVNIGLGYKIILRHKWLDDDADKYSYLSLQVKFNWLGYSNPGGTNYSGNAFTIGLSYGMYLKRWYNILSPEWTQ